MAAKRSETEFCGESGSGSCRKAHIIAFKQHTH